MKHHKRGERKMRSTKQSTSGNKDMLKFEKPRVIHIVFLCVHFNSNSVNLSPMSIYTVMDWDIVMIEENQFQQQMSWKHCLICVLKNMGLISLGSYKNQCSHLMHYKHFGIKSIVISWDTYCILFYLFHFVIDIELHCK